MPDNSVLVTGAAGMLGNAVVDTVPAQFTVLPTTRQQADVTRRDEVRSAIIGAAPRAVIHCAGYTDVDGATRNPRQAHAVNAEGTKNVAAACHDADCRLIYISSDYVFDGTKESPYTEEDEPNPQNAYGRSKLAGERYAMQEHDSVLIVRSQWLFGPGGSNFVNTIVHKAQTAPQLQVVADEYGCPTYTMHLAQKLWQLVARDVDGILHCTNQGLCAWVDLARHALNEAGISDVRIEPISRDEWDSPTTRPGFSALESARNSRLDLKPLPPWQTAVTEYVGQYLIDR